jgi:hypothetical protein
MLSQADRDWLKKMDVAMQPQPMVSIEMYCAAVDSSDHVTRQNYVLRRQRARLLKKLRRGRRVRLIVALVASAVVLAFVVLAKQ